MVQRANIESARVDQLIKKFQQHNKEFEYKQRSIINYFKQLQTHWNDHHYQATSQYFEEYDKAIKQGIKMAEEIIMPHLKNVKKFAEDYERLGKR